MGQILSQMSICLESSEGRVEKRKWCPSTYSLIWAFRNSLISVLGDAKKKHSQYQLETSCRGGGSYLVSSVKKVTSPKRLLGGNATHTALKYITGDFYNEKLETGKEKMKFCKKRTKTPVEKKKPQKSTWEMRLCWSCGWAWLLSLLGNSHSQFPYEAQPTAAKELKIEMAFTCSRFGQFYLLKVETTQAKHVKNKASVNASSTLS